MKRLTKHIKKPLSGSPKIIGGNSLSDSDNNLAISKYARLITPERIHFGLSVTIMDFAVIGFPNEDQSLFDDPSSREVIIGSGVKIYPWVLIFEGAMIEDNVVLEERTTVGSRTKIGARSRVLYQAQVYDNINIGPDCIIGGFIGNNSRIGSKCSIFGSLVHRYEHRDPTLWNITDEPGPTIEDNVLIGFGAVIVGNVTIGAEARIHPNAVVTKNVNRGEVVSYGH